MTDPLRDPRFPNRPQHPDFWRIADVLNQLDGESLEGGKDLPEIVVGMVDLESLIYSASNRAIKQIELLGLPNDTRMRAALTATFLNAFLAGVQFERAGGHR